MRAIVITTPGDPEVLELHDDVPTPQPAAGELLVRVQATGLNRAELMQRRGNYPAPPGVPQNIPGLEYAGVIDALGSGVTGWSEGERVMGLVSGGGYAEYVTARADHVLRVPERLTIEQAAAIPEAYFTAHDALFTQALATSGESMLVHAIASGVGVALLQLGQAFGLRTIGTSRTAAKLERLRKLGLEHAIEVTSPQFFDAVTQAAGADGVDIVIDLVGGDYLHDNLRVLESRGRLVIVGLVGGRSAPLDMRLVLSKRLRIIGTAMRSRAAEEKAEVTRFFGEHALPLFADGTIEPFIDDVIEMDGIVDAHRRMEANRTIGKIVMRISS